MTSLNKKAWVSKRSSQCLIKWSDALCLTMIAKICCPQSRKRLRTFNWRIESSLQSKHILAKACNIFLVHSLSKNTYVSKYLFSLLFTILVKNSINNLCWSKLCPKLNFRQNLYKAYISIKRTIFFAPMVSALEGFHCNTLSAIISTMKEERLESLLSIQVHRDRTPSIEKIIESFASLKSRRLTLCDAYA